MVNPMLTTDPSRSALMSRVRQKDTRPELVVRGALRAMGIFYRVGVKDLPGRPDISNKRHRWVIFVQGCFWHHHTGCRRARLPKRNREFWSEKFRQNRSRDATSVRALLSMGYRVLLIWECTVLQRDRLQARLARFFATGRTGTRVTGGM